MLLRKQGHWNCGHRTFAHGVWLWLLNQHVFKSACLMRLVKLGVEIVPAALDISCGIGRDDVEESSAQAQATVGYHPRTQVIKVVKSKAVRMDATDRYGSPISWSNGQSQLQGFFICLHPQSQSCAFQGFHLHIRGLKEADCNSMGLACFNFHWPWILKW